MSRRWGRKGSWLRRLEPRFALSELRRIRSKWWRRLLRVDERVIRLEPAGEPLGRVLFSYILDPFLLPCEDDIPYWHTHYWESFAMARCFVEEGYQVDCISWTNHRFQPAAHYDILVDVRLNLERLAPLVDEAALKVFHIDTAHYLFHNSAQGERLDRIRRQRGVSLKRRKRLEENRGIEVADCATVLGNEFTQGTYAFAHKPLFRIPISVPTEYPWPADRDLETARRRFLWFGSTALVHKGLDLVLEAFAGMPEAELVVCGPVRKEADFEEAYRRELYETPNIRTEGWVDVAGDRFREILSSCIGAVYPSCSEGGGGSVISCMHGGLIPVVGYETSVDVDPSYGVLLDEASVEEIRRAVRRLAGMPPGELEAMARRSRDYAREHHTREAFRREYRRFVGRLADGSWRQGPVAGEDGTP